MGDRGPFHLVLLLVLPSVYSISVIRYWSAAGFTDFPAVTHPLVSQVENSPDLPNIDMIGHGYDCYKGTATSPETAQTDPGLRSPLFTIVCPGCYSENKTFNGAPLHAHAHAHAQTGTQVHKHNCTCTHAHARTQVYTHTRTHARMHTRARTHAPRAHARMQTPADSRT